MYTEWASLANQITTNVNGSQQQSTLNKFNPLISRDVTAALVSENFQLEVCRKDTEMFFRSSNWLRVWEFLVQLNNLSSQQITMCRFAWM